MAYYVVFLAHLSTKCSWWAIVVSGCPASVVVRRASSVVRQHLTSYPALYLAPEGILEKTKRIIVNSCIHTYCYAYCDNSKSLYNNLVKETRKYLFFKSEYQARLKRAYNRQYQLPATLKVLDFESKPTFPLLLFLFLMLYFLFAKTFIHLWSLNMVIFAVKFYWVYLLLFSFIM